MSEEKNYIIKLILNKLIQSINNGIKKSYNELKKENIDYQGFISNLKNFYPIVSNGGIYILEDFVFSDKFKLEEREFNISKGHKIFEPVTMTMGEFFNNIKNKKFFKHSYLTDKEIEYIIQNTKDVVVEYTEHPFGSLGIIYKN